RGHDRHRLQPIKPCVISREIASLRGLVDRWVGIRPILGRPPRHFIQGVTGPDIEYVNPVVTGDVGALSRDSETRQLPDVQGGQCGDRAGGRVQNEHRATRRNREVARAGAGGTLLYLTQIQRSGENQMGVAHGGMVVGAQPSVVKSPRKELARDPAFTKDTEGAPGSETFKKEYVKPAGGIDHLNSVRII